MSDGSVLRDIYFNQLTLKCDKWIPYLSSYERYFSKFVGKPITFVEVGVQGGGSLQMWRKFFGPEAKIYGIDIDESVLIHQSQYDGNVNIIIGDQGDEKFWDSFLSEIGGIDVFIDDGSHLAQHQKLTFQKVFPHINIGGVFLCEDTHTNYWRYNPQFILDLPPIPKKCRVEVDRITNESFMEFSKRVVDFIHYDHINDDLKNKFHKDLEEVCEGVTSVHFHNSIVVFEKDEPQVFERIVVNEE